MPFVPAPLSGNDIGATAAPDTPAYPAADAPTTHAMRRGSSPPPSMRLPPQGSGAPQRFRIDGAPAGQEKLNVAMKTLLDPTARMSASRVYSGQTRNWTR